MPPILLATRGSRLALAQAEFVRRECLKKFPKLAFALKIIKTTGDKLQAAAPSPRDPAPPRGLFTKELEAALLRHQADIAVHSLKDLPTDLPPGLKLAAVAGPRADVRDVLIYRTGKRLPRGMKLKDLPVGLTVATGSPRRQTQLLDLRPDFKTVPIRGNVPTRLRTLAASRAIQATILAAAGLARLEIRIAAAGQLRGDGVPDGLCAVVFQPEEMLPCVGQGAIGLEIRAHDPRLAALCRKLNHRETFSCVTAERSFLRAMGGGCQTPVGAYASVTRGRLQLRAVAHLTATVQRAAGTRPIKEADALGRQVAAKILASNSRGENLLPPKP